MNAQEGIQRLEAAMKREWETLRAGSRLVSRVLGGTDDRRLYVLYLAETFHYTSHNAKNQAAVALNIQGHTPRDMQYMKYCLEHASEEVGHQLMAYKDMRMVGVNVPVEDLPEALPATEVLVAYLYKVAQSGNPVRRLGYSFWAEQGYAFFGDVMMNAAKNMRLSADMMTFFKAHSTIDEDHAREVRAIIENVARTERDWADIETVLVTTLRLTARMLDDVETEYQRVLAGTSPWNVIFAAQGTSLKTDPTVAGPSDAASAMS